MSQLILSRWFHVHQAFPATLFRKEFCSWVGVQQRPLYMSLEVPKKELNWKFIPSSRSFQAVLILLNYRNVTKMWPLQKHILSHFWAHTSLWHNPNAWAACAWSAAFVGELEPPWLCNTWALETELHGKSATTIHPLQSVSVWICICIYCYNILWQNIMYNVYI